MAAECSRHLRRSSSSSRSFNGAAARWPRKCRQNGIGTLLSVKKLQWGRGAMAAEWREVKPDAQARRGLQWGRGAMAAEWPRQTPIADLNRILLQWGRGAMAAECRSCRRDARFAMPGFNGAAARWPRKANARRGASLALSRSFNGAAARWPRSGGDRRAVGADSGRFNGAAARGRGVPGQRRSRDLRWPASMGPRRDGRGMPGPPRGCATVSKIASMGPRPMAAECAARWHSGRGSGRASMGPRPMAAE